MKRAIVLGGSGFIGARIVACLAESSVCECVALSSTDCDLADRQACLRVLTPLLKDSYIIYAAGITRLQGDTLDTMLTNQRMVQNVIDCCAEARPWRVVFLSSADVYCSPSELPISETTPLRPTRFHGVGKVAAEMLWQKWHRQSGVPLAMLRLPGVYGPGDSGKGLIGALVRAARSSQTFHLQGDGSARRDFLFVDDIARIVCRLAEVEYQETTLNVATGTSRSVAEIMEQVFSLYGECPVTRGAAQPGECDLEFDVTRLHEQLPDLRMTPLEEGLRAYGREADQ